MCTVSIFAEDWTTRNPQWAQPTITMLPWPDGPTRAEFDALKNELESLKKLLRAAKIYDEETGQPDCEDAEKVALFKRLAKLCDVDLSEVFAEEAT